MLCSWAKPVLRFKPATTLSREITDKLNAAAQAALAIERATFDAEKCTFANQAHAESIISLLNGIGSKRPEPTQRKNLWHTPGDPSKAPEPPLALEGDNIAGTGDPDDPATAKTKQNSQPAIASSANNSNTHRRWP